MFFIFANCNFVPDHYDAWQAAFDQLAEYVEANEPNTMTYYCGIPIDYARDFSKTPSMFAFESYASREYLYETHIRSEAMERFLAAIPEHSTADPSLNHYSCVGGYLDRDGDKEGCAIMIDQGIVTKNAESRSSFLKRLEQLTSKVQSSEKENRSGVLTFLGFSCLDNETGARIYARFESREAMEDFLRRQDVNEFWMESKADIVSMEAHRYVPNGKGWLHRNGDRYETGKAI